MKTFNKGPKQGAWKSARPTGERSREAGFEGRDTGRPIHRATCSECNKACQVPFKPNGSKPVLCNACFNRDSFSDQKRTRGREFEQRSSFGFNKRPFESESRGYGNKNKELEDQFKVINAKLDAILRALQ